MQNECLLLISGHPQEDSVAVPQQDSSADSHNPFHVPQAGRDKERGRKGARPLRFKATGGPGCIGFVGRKQDNMC